MASKVLLSFLFIYLTEILFLHGKISPPSNLMRTSSRSKSFTLQWSSSEQDDAIYRIFVQKDFVAPPKMSSRANYVTSPFTATKTASGDDLQANTLYDVYLFAVNPTNSSDYAYTTLEGVVTGPPPPTDVQISNVESSSIEVTWQHSTSGTAQQTTNYEVTYATNGETMSTMQTNSAIVNHLTISGLSPNSFYSINVVALTDTDNILSDKSPSVSTTTAPSQLDPPTCSDVTSNSISLEWEDSTESAVTYTLSWSPSSEDGSNKKPGITTTSTTVYGLNTNTQYSFILAVLNNAGVGMPSNEAVFVTIPGSPNSPRLSLPGAMTTQIQVKWSPPIGGDAVSSYVIDWWPTSDVTNAVSAATVSHVNGTMSYVYVIENLTPGKSYDVSVTAANAAGFGEPSSTSRLRTVPAQPSNVIMTQQEAEKTTSLLVTWTRPQGEVDSYLVKVYRNNSLTLSTITNMTSFIAKGLEPGAAYSASVTGISDQVSSEESSRSNEQRTNPPKPIDVKLQPTNENKTSHLNVMWSMTNYSYLVSSYEITLSSSSQILTVQHPAGEGSFSNYLFNDLIPGENYVASVQAVSPSSVQAPGTQSEAVTSNSQRTVPKPPKPDVEATTSNTVTLSWTQPEGVFTHYNIFYAKAGGNMAGSSFVQIIDGYSKSYVVSGLSSSSEYFFQMSSVSGNDSKSTESEKSDPVTAVTAEIIGQPQSVQITSTTSTTISVSWSQPVDYNVVISGYRVSCTSSDDEQTSVTVSSSARSATISGLTSNTVYCITIAGTSSQGDGAYSDCVKAITTLGKPKTITMTSDTISTADLSWTSSEGGGRAANVTRYVVSWSPPDNGGFVDVIPLPGSNTMFTKLKGLKSSSNYYISVASQNHVGNGETSEFVNITTLPGTPYVTSVSTSSSYSTYIYWNKPDGGDVIDDFLVEYWREGSSSTYRYTKTANPGTTSYSFSFSTSYGYGYTVRVSARNSEGTGFPSQNVSFTAGYSTFSETTATPNFKNPSTKLDLTWKIPNRHGDLLVQYEGKPSSLKNLKVVKFTDKNTSLDVKPGNNYTIFLTVLEGDSPEPEKTIHVSTKPSEPVYSLECSVNAIKLTWSHPEGFVENYLVQYISAQSIETKKLDKSMTSYTIDDVVADTDHVIMLYAIIYDVNGIVERSTSTARSCTTLKNANETVSRKRRSAESIQSGLSLDFGGNDAPAKSAAPGSIMIAGLLVGSLLLVLALLGSTLLYKRKQGFLHHEDFPN
ncbi:fibronectin-like isoform X1 [Clavelina lepadiformis]|uniref:fibronectin-like isoform X1 n=1 Tax=Clavelina lepadiformis TaxID=159417 RepID=UPI004043407D